MELPATLPGSLREQLMALLPYATHRGMGFFSNGRTKIIIDFLIPNEVVLYADINERMLRQHGIELEIQREKEDCTGWYRLTMPEPEFTKVRITINSVHFD